MLSVQSVAYSHCRTGRLVAHLLLKLLPQLVQGLVQLLITQLGHFSDHLTAHGNQRSILHQAIIKATVLFGIVRFGTFVDLLT